MPLPRSDKVSKISTSLSAANGTSIRTWGKCSISLTLSSKPNQHYKHEFYLADVTRPILGAIFSRNMDLPLTYVVNVYCLLTTYPFFLKNQSPRLFLRVYDSLAQTSIPTCFNSFLSSSFHTSTTRQTSMVSNITLSPMALQHMPEQGDLTKKNCLLLKQNFFIWKSWALSVAPNLLGLHPFMRSLNLGENGYLAATTGV